MIDNHDDEFIFRTEDIKSKDLAKIFVETKVDRENINYLKNKSPILLVGSRGTGKTMLLRMAEKELDDEFEQRHELAIFVSFSKAIFVDVSKDILFFRQWMLAKILFNLKRKLERKGFLLSKTGILNTYFNLQNTSDNLVRKLDDLIYLMENSWNNRSINIYEEANKIFEIDTAKLGILKDVDYFKALIEDICENYGIDRITLLFDEACHNFIPIQQREFFTLFRDLRCPYISCKAAVYPGITSYGTFQAFHDAIIIKVERDITSSDYIDKMRDIVKNQLGSDTYKIFEQQGDNLNALIYAASGNPRLLLKSIYIASDGLKSLKTNNVNNTVKSFYRTNIWNEHSKLSEIYKGHKQIIDWGREFVENNILIDTFNKNKKRIEDEKSQQTIYFAIHRDAPEAVKKAIRILEYSGIVTMHTEGTKVRKEIYDRYQINFGVVLSSEPTNSPVNRYKELIGGLSIKLYTDYGVNSHAYSGIDKIIDIDKEVDSSAILKEILSQPIEKLDISDFQCNTLRDSGFISLGDILSGNEKDLQKAYLIGPIRARRILNIAFNATIEYISG